MHSCALLGSPSTCARSALPAISPSEGIFFGECVAPFTVRLFCGIVSSFIHSIPQIVGRRSNKKVFGIEARRIIARMTNKLVAIEGHPKPQVGRKTMGVNLLSKIMGDPISIRSATAAPIPATRLFVQLHSINQRNLGRHA